VIKVRGDTELSQRMIEITRAMRMRKMIQEQEGGQWSFPISVRTGLLKAVTEELAPNCRPQEKVEQVQVTSR
jgi:hypothetical protein